MGDLIVDYHKELTSRDSVKWSTKLSPDFVLLIYIKKING